MNVAKVVEIAHAKPVVNKRPASPKTSTPRVSSEGAAATPAGIGTEITGTSVATGVVALLCNCKYLTEALALVTRIDRKRAGTVLIQRAVT